MRFTPRIFRAHDIAGISGKDFDTAFGERLGNRVASYLKMRTCIVGRDGASQLDAAAVMAGASKAGARVINIGHVSVPQFRWALNYFHGHGIFVGGGFQVCDPSGQAIGGDRLRQIYDSQASLPSEVGQLESHDIITPYAAEVMRTAQWNRGPIPVSLDAPDPIRRALVAIAPIAPHHGLAIRFDPHGQEMAVYVNAQPWHDWASHISSQAVRMPELAVLELVVNLHGLPNEAHR